MIYRNAWVVTMDDAGTEHEHGWLEVEDGLITELGAGLRRLEHRGQPVTVGYEPDMLPPGAAGQLLCPWPNRVDGGRYAIDGTHYQRTADHWLKNQDANRDEVMQVLTAAYGEALAPLWFQRWRMFWMACAELFGYRGGNEWLVGHYLFAKR